MSDLKDVEQLPSCQHFESADMQKSRLHDIVPEARQSSIRRKVNQIKSFEWDKEKT